MPEGAVMRHWQRALFGYLFELYPGDPIVPVVAVNSTGLPLLHTMPVLNTVDYTGLYW